MLTNTESILKEVNKTLNKYQFGKEPQELYQPIDYMMGLGGKRLRPLLSILSYLIFEDDYKKALKPSLAIEVFHNFTLMHDDIMDNAPLRRGQATVHTKWNNNIAILSGDVMLVKSYELFEDLDQDTFKKVVEAFNKIAIQVCEGQQFDMNYETQAKVSVEQYLEMIRLKTAVLIGFSLQLGGLLAGVDKKQAEALYKAGEAIGIGFQLQDDYLDTFGGAKTGKKIGGDIAANKKTFLLIRSLEKAKGKSLSELESLLKEKDEAKKITGITQLYKTLEVDKETEALVNQYFQEGFEHLQKVKGSIFRRGILKTFVQQLITREN